MSRNYHPTVLAGQKVSTKVCHTFLFRKLLKEEEMNKENPFIYTKTKQKLLIIFIKNMLDGAALVF